MVTKIYIILIIAIVIFIIFSIFLNTEKEETEDEKYEKIIQKVGNINKKIIILLCILFYGINFYIYKTKFWGRGEVIILPLSIIIGVPTFIVVLVVGYILENIKFKYFESIKKAIIKLLTIFGIIILGLGICIFLLFCTWLLLDSKTSAQYGEKDTYKEYNYSIEIKEIDKVPYTNVTSSRFYIRSSPSVAYYYDVTTKSGNQTTKILDGNKYYVEKDEDDKYIDNPHIEVYNIINRYTNVYGKEIEEFVTYEYIICVPENSIYYEKN